MEFLAAPEMKIKQIVELACGIILNDAIAGSRLMDMRSALCYRTTLTDAKPGAMAPNR